MNAATRTLHLDHALTPDGCRRDVRLTLKFGAIAAVEVGAAAQAGDERHDPSRIFDHNGATADRLSAEPA